MTQTTITRTQALDQIKLVAKFLEELEKPSGRNATNLFDIVETIREGVKGRFGDELIEEAQARLDQVGGILSPSEVRAFFAPALADFSTAVGIEPNGFAADFQTFRDDLLAQTPSIDTISQRDLTLGTPTASGSPTGTGLILRCTEGPDGERLDGVTPEIKTLVCDRDGGESQFDYRERFQLLGAPIADRGPKQWAQLAGSGIRGVSIVSRDASKSSDVGVQNPSWETFNGVFTGDLFQPALATDIGSWVMDTPANFAITKEAAKVFRGGRGQATPAALRLSGNGKITQTLSTPTFAEGVPYPVAFALRREDAEGTLRVGWGNKTQDFSIDAQANNAYTQLAIDRDLDAYFKNFRPDNNQIDLSFEWLGGPGAGSPFIYLDDVVWDAMDPADGQFFSIIGGATRWKRGDKYTITDTEASLGSRILGYWLNYRARPYEAVGSPIAAPNAAVPTIADPV